jgi:hypothetical protein
MSDLTPAQEEEIAKFLDELDTPLPESGPAPTLINSGPVTDQEWEAIREYRALVEFRWEQELQELGGNLIQYIDNYTTTYSDQFRKEFGIDTTNQRVLYYITWGCAIHYFFVSQATLQCGASGEIKMHSMHHIQQGSLKLDFILRQLLLAAGAPSVKPEEPKTIYDLPGS